ncbi:ABC transporter permease [Chlorobium sp. N1]|nr:ABC transporter permease [Chlorobium sp. N1]
MKRRPALPRPALWIAGRFSFARKRFRVINIISAISLAGIVIGVSTLLVVMSVLNGFQKLAEEMFLTLDSPVQIVAAEGRTMPFDERLLDSVLRLPSVASAEPFSEGDAILAVGRQSELVRVKGITPSAEKRLRNITGAGVPYFFENGVSLGELLAYRTRVLPGERVRLFSPELVSLGLHSLSQPYLLAALRIPEPTVASFFNLQKLFDDRYVVASRELASAVLLIGKGECSGIDVRAQEGVPHERLHRELSVWLESRPDASAMRLRTLESRYRDIFAVMVLEKWVSFGVLMLIVLVASLSLTGALAMTAIDKQEDLFSLRCLGMEGGRLEAIFMLQGALTGIAGALIGSGLAWVISSLQERFGLVQLPSKSAFVIDAYPVHMVPSDFLVVGLSSIALSLLVSIFPARKASRSAEERTRDLMSS